MEFLGSFFLLISFIGLAVDQRAPKGMYGMGIGATLTFCILSAYPATGAALNPIRYYGPKLGAAMVTGDWTGTYVWIYMTPFLGAVVGALMYKYLYLDESRRTDELTINFRDDSDIDFSIHFK